MSTDPKTLDAILTRRSRGQAAAQTLEVVGPVLAEEEGRLVTTLVGAFRGGTLTPEAALAGISAVSVLREVRDRLAGQVRDGEVAGAEFVGGGRRA